jgi:hypothetical protein
MNRSAHRDEALRLALDAERARIGAAAAVLTTEDGLLVAGAGEGIDFEAMAAHAPLLTSGVEASQLRRAEALALTCGRALQATPIRAGGQRLFYAAITASIGVPDRLEAAADRILGA